MQQNSNQPVPSENIPLRIENAVNGDRDALLELLLDCQREVGQFVANQLGSAPNVRNSEDDILQEAYIDAFTGISRLEARTWDGFVGWVKKIALNRIRDNARRHKAKKRGGDFQRIEKASSPFQSHAVELVTELAADENSPSQFAARKEAVDAIQIAIAELPEDQRTAILLVSFQKQTLAEAAEQMKKTPDAVRGLLQRAKKAIKMSLHKSTLWLSRK